MNLIKWSYTKRYNIKAIYADFPNSAVIFRPINQYYFVYNINWSENDPPVTKENLEQMEQRLNDELGTGHFYRNRKSKKQGVPAVKKAMVIANPSSGKEQAEEHIDQIKEQLKKSEYSVDIRLTEGEGDATRFAKEACDSKYDAIIAMGGDGTMNETVNGLAEQTHRPKMGVIPLGTVNDFARALNVPLDPKEAIGVLVDKTNLTDVGKINNHYFLNTLALGGIAEATGEVTSEQKTSMGSLAYIIEGLKTLTDKTPFTITVEADNGTYEEESLLFLAALTNSVAGFEKLAPDAKVADGQFHCFIVKDVALPKLLRIGANLLKGDFQKDPDVIYFTSEKLTINSSMDLKANVDGDMADTVPLELKVLPGHLAIFTP